MSILSLTKAPYGHWFPWYPQSRLSLLPSSCRSLQNFHVHKSRSLHISSPHVLHKYLLTIYTILSFPCGVRVFSSLNTCCYLEYLDFVFSCWFKRKNRVLHIQWMFWFLYFEFCILLLFELLIFCTWIFIRVSILWSVWALII